MSVLTDAPTPEAGDLTPTASGLPGGAYFPDEDEDETPAFVHTWLYFWIDGALPNVEYGSGFLRTTEDATGPDCLLGLREGLGRPHARIHIYRVGAIGGAYAIGDQFQEPTELNVAIPCDMVLYFPNKPGATATGSNVSGPEQPIPSN